MKKKSSKIPRFKTLEDEAAFWDTHSVTDFEDEMEDVDMVFELDKPREETLIVRVQKNMKTRMQYIARRKGLNVSTLARMWLLERLRTYSTSD